MLTQIISREFEGESSLFSFLNDKIVQGPEEMGHGMEQVEPFITNFLQFQEWFLSAPIVLQVIILIGLVALTVAILALLYNIIRFFVLITIKLFKWIFQIDKSNNLTNTQNQKQQVAAQVQTNNPTITQINQPLPAQHPIQTPISIQTTVRQNTTQSTSNNAITTKGILQQQTIAPMAYETKTMNKPVNKYHCPMCGQEFTNKMMKLASEKKRFYCEYCGQPLEHFAL